MPEPCYDDLRPFLAVAETGTTLAASRRLGTSQSTVARRIAALEAAMGLELFRKRRDGYALTEAGRELLEPAREAERAMRAFVNAAGTHRRGLTGTVRLTMNEAFAARLMAPLVQSFRERQPGLRLELVTTSRRLDLGAGEAEIALRAGPRPSEPDLFGRKIADDHWSVWCSRAYAEAHGTPRSAEEMRQHAVVGIDSRITGLPMVEWLRRNVPDDVVVIRQNNPAAMIASIRGGLGVGLGPDLLLVDDPSLLQCFTPDLPPVAEIWLLTHERLRHVPRIRAALEVIADAVARHLAGSQG